MSNAVDRRRFLTTSAMAAAGALLPGVELEAASPGTSGTVTPISLEETSSGVLIRNGTEIVRITVCAPDVIHIVAGPGKPAAASPATPWMVTPEAAQRPKVVRTGSLATVRTPALSVEVDLSTGLLRFLDPDGKTLLQESPRVPRRYEPQQVNGEWLCRVDQRFYPDALEGIYGLGQHQSGVFDQRGTV